MGEICVERSIVNHIEDKQNNNKKFKAVKMSYWGSIFHEFVNILTLDKYIVRIKGSLCVVVVVVVTVEGEVVFNYAYMRKTVLDILPAGQD